MNLLKGAQKQLISLQTGKSRYFEGAFFILRPQVRQTKANGTDMLIEANRILRESMLGGQPARRNFPVAKAICFLAGGLIGAGISFLIAYLCLRS